jgi:hypothetical protein
MFSSVGASGGAGFLETLFMLGARQASPSFQNDLLTMAFGDVLDFQPMAIETAPLVCGLGALELQRVIFPGGLLEVAALGRRATSVGTIRAAKHRYELELERAQQSLELLLCTIFGEVGD